MYIASTDPRGHTHTHNIPKICKTQRSTLTPEPHGLRLHYITLHYTGTYIHVCEGEGEREREREEGGEASERESRTATASEIDKQTDKHERSITLNPKP